MVRVVVIYLETMRLGKAGLGMEEFQTFGLIFIVVSLETSNIYCDEMNFQLNNSL